MLGVRGSLICFMGSSSPEYAKLNIMHELRIMHDMFKIIEEAAKENNLKKVTAVSFMLGEACHIVPEFFNTAFDIVKENTIASDSKLTIEVIPIKMLCKICNFEFAIKEEEYACPKCRSLYLVLISGKELVIKNIEGE